MRRGFTIIEVLTVVTIIGILVAISGYVYTAAMARSRDNTRLSNLNLIKGALEEYYLDNRQYPPVKSGPGKLYTAKYQLENISDRCAYTSNNTPGNFLVPQYLQAVPEDPTKKMPVASCSLATQSGQLLYVTGAASGSERPQKYLMLAKMERSNNMSTNTAMTAAKNLINSSAYAAQVNAFLETCNAASYKTQPNCTHNYALTNSRNN